MIAIVGGGITGLALGHELARLGADFVVVEAADRPGGVIRTEEIGGHLLEWGPQRTRFVGPVLGLVAALGLEGELVPARGDLEVLVWSRGRLHPVPTSPARLARSRALGPLAKARLLLEPLTGGLRKGESVAGYSRRKLGRAPYETFVGPLFGGLYGSDPADMDAEDALAPLLGDLGVRRSLLLRALRGRAGAAPAMCSFRHGMQALPLAIAERLGGRVRLASPARSLARAPSGAWRLELEGASGETIEAEHVVLCTSAPAAAPLLADAAPEAAAALAGLRYNVLGLVHLARGG
ncbi:MAG TPA: protoporphyrinogen oxidase, partial [Longimicrobiales bacterium]|nr:protoporphyrinogen oxidase [Longimicrobiales bacterium]